jgi:hypothetical protein
MAKQAWQNALSDPDFGAASYGQRPSAVGAFFRWLLGLLTIGALTLGGAYYLPLYRAHKALTHDYELVTQKHDVDTQNIARLQTELKAVTQARDDLSAKSGKAEAVQSAVRDRASKLQADVSAKLAKAVSKGFVSVALRDGSLAVAFPALALKAPDNVELTPAASAMVCEAVRAIEGAGAPSMRVVAYASAAAPTATTDAWTSGSARATAVVRVLGEKCRYPGDKVAAVSVLGGAAGGTTPPAFELDAGPAAE